MPSAALLAATPLLLLLLQLLLLLLLGSAPESVSAADTSNCGELAHLWSSPARYSVSDVVWLVALGYSSRLQDTMCPTFCRRWGPERPMCWLGKKWRMRQQCGMDGYKLLCFMSCTCTWCVDTAVVFPSVPYMKPVADVLVHCRKILPGSLSQCGPNCRRFG